MATNSPRRDASHRDPTGVSRRSRRGGASGHQARAVSARRNRSGPRRGAAGALRAAMPARVRLGRADRRDQVGEFYAEHAGHVRRIVAARVRANEQTIEDACQHAWAALLRFEDIDLDPGGVAWLIVVAVREVWRLASVRRELPAGALCADDGGEAVRQPDLVERPEEHTIARAEHDQRVADLRRLKPRERRELFLHAVGYAYTEIAALTGSSYTGVNRRLAEGRAALRRMEHARRAAA